MIFLSIKNKCPNRMTTYLRVLNRDINFFKSIALSNLNNNNSWVILFYGFFIVFNLTILFNFFFYFTVSFLFLLILLFLLPFLIYDYVITSRIPIELKIKSPKETIGFKIKVIEKNLFIKNQSNVFSRKIIFHDQ